MVPLVPVRSLDDGGLYLQRGRVEADAGSTTGALGRVLEPESALLIIDAEVPATGARVTRSWQGSPKLRRRCGALGRAAQERGAGPTLARLALRRAHPVGMTGTAPRSPSAGRTGSARSSPQRELGGFERLGLGQLAELAQRLLLEPAHPVGGELELPRDLVHGPFGVTVEPNRIWITRRSPPGRFSRAESIAWRS